MQLLSTLTMLEENDHLHLGRLLILLGAFAGKDGSGSIDGLTKLAKLDFLLRYPTYLEKALQNKKTSVTNLEIDDHERRSVESSMVRFHYGPWDFRYRRFINILVAKGLAKIIVQGKTIRIYLTTAGVTSAMVLAKAEEFKNISKRARILKSNFNMKGSKLMKFIYETFPEIVTLRLGQEIR